MTIDTKHRSIQTEIPGDGTTDILERLARVQPRSMSAHLPIVWDSVNAHSVYDLAGNKFIDFTSGIFVANVGHANLHVLDAIDQPFLHSYTYATEQRIEYLEKLTAWSGFEKAFLLSSGTEATEAALRIMRLWGKRQGKNRLGIVCLEGGFHGRTMGARLMSGKAIDGDLKDPDIHHISLPPANDPDGLYYFFNRCMGELCNNMVDVNRDICGFMVETFRAWDARFYPPRFVQAIEMFCKQRNALLCFDEMQAGFARTGKKFGFQHYEVKPHLICVGKGMGGGFPLSGVLGSAELLDLPDDLSSTHSANPLACAAGSAVIDEIDRLDLVRETARKGQILLSELEKLPERFSKTVQYVSGEGLIWAVVFKEEGGADLASRVSHRAMQNGLIVTYTGRESIKIGPPLVIPDDALKEGAEVLCQAIAAEG